MKLPLQAACQLLCTRSNLFLSLFHIKLKANFSKPKRQMNIFSNWLNIAPIFVNIQIFGNVDLFNHDRFEFGSTLHPDKVQTLIKRFYVKVNDR